MNQYKLEPDLFTLGKIIGGGLPIGALCGKKEVMSFADTTNKTDKSTYCSIGGGTFSANPLTMTAGYTTLKFLKNSPMVYEKINSLGDLARNELTKLFNDLKIAVEIKGFGSLFMIHFLNDKVKKINNATDSALSNNELLFNYHFALIAKYNIFFLPLKMGAFSYAHGKEDVYKLVEATRGVFQDNKIHSPQKNKLV
jgi:glutamate-1-semialdehyde 2,1-aminomutase